MTELAPRRTTVTLAIVGGGLSGAAVAYRLAQDAPLTGLRIVVVEPRADLGRGIAYSTPDPDHRSNVPHGKMSISAEDMADFARWLSGPSAPSFTPSAVADHGHIFAPRAVFGTYVAETLAQYLDRGRVRHLRTTAEDIEADGPRLRIALADGGTLAADAVLLALTHPAPAVPGPLRALVGHPGPVTDPFAPGALDGIDPGERVLVVGTGLTSADILATLHRRAHRGLIHVLSRYGWRSRPHGPVQGETAEDFAIRPETTALGLLRRVRRALRRDQGAGLTWHAVFDRLRAQGATIWAALPQDERRRFLRHLRGLWDVHRFRMAPQTYDIVTEMNESGRAAFVAGHLLGAEDAPKGVRVSWRAQGCRDEFVLTVDRIILATGPDHARVTETGPLFRRLAQTGLIGPDPLGLGLYTATGGEAIGRSGAATANLFVAGPLARGTVGELMGVPEVTGWAAFVARRALDIVSPRLPQATGGQA